MRVATYAVPAAKGAEAGECAVFFFGPGQGGGIDDNVARWAKQFEGAPAPKRTTATVGGMRVTRAEVAGTYLAPGGPMMQSTGKRPGYRLLGAIVEAPRGTSSSSSPDPPARSGRRRPISTRSSPRSGRSSRVALRAAVFDFDGVIVDSEPLHFRSLRDALATEGVEITRGGVPGAAPRLRRPRARSASPSSTTASARTPRAVERDRGAQGRAASPS